MKLVITLLQLTHERALIKANQKLEPNSQKYLEIEYEPTLVKKYTTTDFIEQCKTIYSIDEFGDSSRLRWAYDEYGKKARLIPDFGLSTAGIGTILPDLQDNIYFYDVKIQFNEKFFEYKTNSKTVLSHRGTKKLVNDKLDKRHRRNQIFGIY